MAPGAPVIATTDDFAAERARHSTTRQPPGPFPSRAPGRSMSPGIPDEMPAPDMIQNGVAAVPPRGAIRALIGPPPTLPGRNDPEPAFVCGGMLVREMHKALSAFERAFRTAPANPRCISYYGLCLVKSRQDPREGMRLCERAAKHAFFHADILANLAQVYAAAGFRQKAFAALERGMKLDANDRTLLAVHDTMGRRRPPVFGFLGRGHPVNRIAGRIRHAFAEKGQRA